MIHCAAGSRFAARLRCGLIVALLVGGCGWPLSTATSDDIDLYSRDVRPLLRERCFACHGALKQEAGLRLDTGALIRAGGDSGQVVLPEEPDESLLLQRVTAIDSDERMPPEGNALTAVQIDVLRNWVSLGAISPADEQPEADPNSHWSFQRLTRPEAPIVAASIHSANPIDLFIHRKLAENTDVSQSYAPKYTQLRRVYLDLIGVPPTRDELHLFLNDSREDSWDRLVDRLLADPRYGERWARHWMDIWRYSDWYGRRNVPDVWNSAPQIWRWRDWIVESLNGDKGYDQMIREMLAADEICPEDYEAGHATGFLIRNWYALNPNDWMRANVEHVGKAFLGLTFNCAHCHDHKYDPISHDDYFRMRAFFEPIHIRQDRVPGEADPGPYQDYDYSTLRKVQHLGAVRVFDKSPDAPTWFYAGGDERNREEDRGSIAPGVPAILDYPPLTIEEVRLPLKAWYPGLRSELQASMLADAQQAVQDANVAFESAQQSSGEVPQNARDQLQLASDAFAAELESAKQQGRPTAIAGHQSLQFDATQGRRVIQNRLRMVQEHDDSFTIEFDLLIASDAHFNFQLAKHVDKGLTASLIAFNDGSIISYQPDTFTEFEVGRYVFSTGQNQFHVQLAQQNERGECLLTIQSVSDGITLVADTPIALNGWNPVGDPNTGIFLDAQTGSVAAIDELVIGIGEPNEVRFDFEQPKYPAGKDVVGNDGWETSSFGVAPATSVVTAALRDERLASVERQLESARRAVQLPSLRMKATEARLNAARDAFASLEARIVADQAKYDPASDADRSNLAREASRLERKSIASDLNANVLRDEHAFAVAEEKMASDEKLAGEATTATKMLAASRDALAKNQETADDAPSEEYSALSPVYPKTSTGRRLALAQWITSRDNPLTARVAVNHMWARHFHVPLVASVQDFGRNGSKPTHPELLDWLAVELIESGWSMKHLHRLIVTSDVYRRSSKTSFATEASSNAVTGEPPDGASTLLSRMNAGRMEAEVIRDSLLSCGDLLDGQVGGKPLANAEALKTYRRSIYYEVYPEDGGASELSELFDAPSPLECYRRTQSIVPQQALALTNSPLVHQISATMVKNWTASSPGLIGEGVERKFVKDMFEQILTRMPTDEELKLCLQGLATQRQIMSRAPAEQVTARVREPCAIASESQRLRDGEIIK